MTFLIMYLQQDIFFVKGFSFLIMTVYVYKPAAGTEDKYKYLGMKSPESEVDKSKVYICLINFFNKTQDKKQLCQ